MPAFISKLQYKDYEQGEFSDEKERSLEETIQLIKNFPWSAQRAFTDIQETGPSVTIQNEFSEYLKIGLFFNDKYCLYLLDSNGHVSEFHTPSINEVCEMVERFFNSRLDTGKFEKHMFNIGSKSHFKTNDFIYRATIGRLIALSWAFIFFLFIFLYFLIVAPRDIVLVPLLVLLFPIAILTFIAKKYLHYRKCFLQVSKANNVFSFGNEDGEDVYNKRDIRKIVQYSPGGNRNPNEFYVYEICFKNGKVIKISNMMISMLTFYEKFQGVEYEDGKTSSLRAL